MAQDDEYPEDPDLAEDDDGIISEDDEDGVIVDDDEDDDMKEA